MIDSLIAKAAHLPWLVGRLNEIKGRFDPEFHDYFVKDLLRDLINGVDGVDQKVEPILSDYRRGVAFLQANGIVRAYRADDIAFGAKVDELMGRLRLAS